MYVAIFCAGQIAVIHRESYQGLKANGILCAKEEEIKKHLNLPFKRYKAHLI